MVAPPKKSSSFGVEVVTNASQKKKKRKKRVKDGRVQKFKNKICTKAKTKAQKKRIIDV
jgi:hypothetical protein